MKQKRKILRLQNWIVNHYEDWNTICGLGQYPISEQECMRLMKVLVDNDFEEITLVLLSCHFYAVQERAERTLESVIEACTEELRRRGINTESFTKH